MIKQYVVLPPRGIVSQEMRRPVLAHEGADRSIDELIDGLGLETASAVTATAAVLTQARDRSQGREWAISIRQAYNEDGPKLARVAPEAERVLRASGYRLVPLTRYRLAATSESLAASVTPIAGERSRDFLREAIAHVHAQGGPLGDDVTVAVLDTGVDASHPLLQNAVTGGRCTVVGDNTLDYTHCHGVEGGHGTHVAGIIGAQGSPDERGVAPGARLRSYRIFGKDSVAAGASNMSILTAMRAAVDDGCDIINLSIAGSGARDDGVRDAVNFAWDSGTVCVAAAGNQGRRPVSYPAAHHNAIGVSALGKISTIPQDSPDRAHVDTPYSSVDPDVFLARFSNCGPQIDFAGPGVTIISSVPGGGVAAMSGTSMAAPAVAGFAAVALSRHAPILRGARDSSRSEAIFQLLVAAAKPYRLGSFDYEGYGIPQS